MNIKLLTIGAIVKTLALEVQSGQETMLTEVTGGYCSDLLSDVMANSKKGNLWVTYQIHPNIVAVAVLKEMAGIIITGGRKPDALTVKKAQAEKMAILCSPLATFEVVGKLFTLGISGSR